MFTLGRKIDLSYKTNQLIASFVLILAFIVWLATTEITAGISVAGGVFLTWALSRELDPAHDYSAFVSAALSLLILLDPQSIQLLPLFWLLLLLRAVNGITGKELVLLDIAIILGLTAYLSYSNENSLYFLIFVLATSFIGITGNRTKKVVWSAIIGVLLFLFQSYFGSTPLLLGLGNYTILVLLLVLSACLSPVLFWKLSRFKIKDDQGNQAEPSKIFASQLLFSLSILLFVSLGETRTANQLIYLAVIIGLSLYFFGKKISKN